MKPMRGFVLAAAAAAGLLLVSMSGPASAASQLAATPPMGWNSWDAYGLSITEAQFRQNAQVLARMLKPFGWNYAVIDEGWFMKNPDDRPTPEKLVFVIDSNGRYIPDPARFPSVLQAGRNRGFARLAQWVHARGLKFGIHIVRGIPRISVASNLPIAGSGFHALDAADTSDACPWDPTNWGVKDNAAGQAWYDSLIAQYASWGIDYLKVDCISDHPYRPAEIRMIHRAIARSGRSIVLSLSPGPTAVERAGEIRRFAQLWRISDDVWDVWTSHESWPRGIDEHFDLMSRWSRYARPGSWPDADMLPFGYLGPSPGWGVARRTELTAAEQRSVMTLWAVARSPLILGANLTRLDAGTLALLTNRTVIDLDQHGGDAREVNRDGPVIAWTALGAEGTRYLALFNTGETPVAVRRSYAFYGIAGARPSRDVWLDRRLGMRSGVDLTLAGHGSALLELTH